MLRTGPRTGQCREGPGQWGGDTLTGQAASKAFTRVRLIGEPAWAQALKDLGCGVERVLLLGPWHPHMAWPAVAQPQLFRRAQKRRCENEHRQAPKTGLPQLDLGQSPRCPGHLPRALPLCSSDNHFVLPTFRMLVRQGVLGASPQLCTLDIPKGVGREANTQGSQGTSSLESMILARTAEPAGREVADPSETAGNGQRRQAPLAGREVTSCCDTGQAATVQWLTGEQSVVFLQCKQSCRQRLLAGWSFLFRWGAGGGRDLRELSGGAPGWSEEEGFPVWKTAVPGALKGESFLYICAPRLHCHIPRGHSQQDRLLSLGSA